MVTNLVVHDLIPVTYFYERRTGKMKDISCLSNYFKINSLYLMIHSFIHLTFDIHSIIILDTLRYLFIFPLALECARKPSTNDNAEVSPSCSLYTGSMCEDKSLFCRRSFKSQQKCDK